MDYPEIGDKVRLGTGSEVFTVKGITDRGDIILRGARLDDIVQAPLEDIRPDAE